MPDSVINGVFTLAVAALAGMLGYGSAISAAVRKERNAAALEFQSAFFKTLIDIDPHLRLQHGKPVDVFAIIERDYPMHTKAMLQFKQYIPTNKIEDFENAWREYGCYQEEDGKYYPSICQYGSASIFDDGEDKAEKAKRSITKLLTFAELNHKSPFEAAEW